MGELTVYKGIAVQTLYRDPNFFRKITPFDTRLNKETQHFLRGESNSLTDAIDERNLFIISYIDDLNL